MSEDGLKPDEGPKPEAPADPVVSPDLNDLPDPPASLEPDSGPKPVAAQAPPPATGRKLRVKTEDPPAQGTYAKPRRDRGLDSDLGLRSEYGPKPDYGHKRKLARIQLVLLLIIAALAGAAAALVLSSQLLALANLPALLILASLILAAALRLMKWPWARALALTPLAFAVGLLPHALFLIVYNVAASSGGHGDPNFLPTLGGVADAYEGAILRLHARTEGLFQGLGFMVYVLVSVAVIVGLALWSVRAGRLAMRMRAAIGLAQVVLLGALSTTVFCQIPTGYWSPNYAERLAADLASLDQIRTRVLLTEKTAQAVKDNAAAIRQARSPMLRAAVQAIISRQPPLADPLAAARQFGVDYARAAAKAGLIESGLDRLDPGPVGAPASRVADRPTVLATEKELTFERQKLLAAQRGLAAVMADALGGVSTGSPVGDAVAGALVSSFLEDLLDRLAARFDTTWGPDLVSRLALIDSAPDHPLTGDISRFLSATLLPVDQPKFDPTSVGAALARTDASAAAPSVRPADIRTAPRDANSEGQQILKHAVGSAKDHGAEDDAR